MPVYLVQLGMEGATKLHVLHQIRPLALIWSDDADLVRLGSGLQKTCGDLLYICSLSPAHKFNFSSTHITGVLICIKLI